MFRVESGKTYVNATTIKAKAMSAHKDQLLTIMTTYLTRQTPRDEVIASLTELQRRVNAPS